jgi:hypothetical protein
LTRSYRFISEHRAAFGVTRLCRIRPVLVRAPGEFFQERVWSGGPRESHPRAPADPGVTVSRHRALIVLVTRS